MNIDVKQRVVGAIVLVSLAVIVLPFLLPGKGDLAITIEGSNIPPAPDYRFPPLDEAPEPPPAPTQMTVPLGVPAEDGSAAVEDAPKDQPAPEIKAPEKTTAESEPPAVPQKEIPVAKSMPAPGEVSGWIVQLGSFSSQKNALALRDKLRAKGFTTFVEPVKTNGNTVYRVRVGPELSTEAADKLRQKLMQDMSMKGLVQKYP